MGGGHAEHSDGTSPVASSAERAATGRERLTLVRARRVSVFRTFADGVQIQRSGPVWSRRRRQLPFGLVHAAELQGELALCGRPLDLLYEFGRSRHPFERVDRSRRCPTCDLAAGRPTE